jgi:hypothetical protein
MPLDATALLQCASIRAKAVALVASVALVVFAALLAAAGKDPLKAYADTLTMCSATPTVSPNSWCE